MNKFLIILALLICTSPSFAQITLDEKDAPVRTVLEQVFKQSKKQYSIDNQVSGLITMSIQEQSFENTLKLIMRASSVPLTYTIENNVYLVKVRQITQQPSIPPISIEKTENKNNIIFERIPLTFIDPLDLQMPLGRILYIKQFLNLMGASGGMGAGMMGQGGMGMGGFGGGNGGRIFN